MRARRLARSRLTDRAGSIVDAVRSTCGIQAQLQTAAEIGVGIRADGVTQADVRRALWERADARPHLDSARHAPSPPGGRARALDGGFAARETELEPGRRSQLLDAFADALDGRTLLREELADEVAARVGVWAREPLASGWAFLVGDAVRSGLLCHGPPRGSKVTFVRADQWLGETRGWGEREALFEATRRLLRAHGPAGPGALAVLGVKSAAERRELIGALRDELVPVDVEGAAAWLLADDAELPDPAPSVRLLPQWDCYVLGFRERDHLLGGPAKELYWDTRWKRSGRYESPLSFANVLLDGRVAGKWERTVRRGVLEVAVQLADKLTRAQQDELEAEAARVGTILGAPDCQVTVCY